MNEDNLQVVRTRMNRGLLTRECCKPIQCKIKQCLGSFAVPATHGNPMAPIRLRTSEQFKAGRGIVLICSACFGQHNSTCGTSPEASSSLPQKSLKMIRVKKGSSCLKSPGVTPDPSSQMHSLLPILQPKPRSYSGPVGSRVLQHVATSLGP